MLVERAWPALALILSACWLAIETWARRSGRIRLSGDGKTRTRSGEDDLLAKLGPKSVDADPPRRTTSGRLVAAVYVVQIGLTVFMAVSDPWASMLPILWVRCAALVFG